jgi:hypothetical protein
MNEYICCNCSCFMYLSHRLGFSVGMNVHLAVDVFAAMLSWMLRICMLDILR